MNEEVTIHGDKYEVFGNGKWTALKPVKTARKVTKRE
jgi:hypothetical protein